MASSSWLALCASAPEQLMTSAAAQTRRPIDMRVLPFRMPTNVPHGPGKQNWTLVPGSPASVGRGRPEYDFRMDTEQLKELQALVGLLRRPPSFSISRRA